MSMYTKKEIAEMENNAKLFEVQRLSITPEDMKKQWEKALANYPIDKGIKKLLIDLNNAGYYTVASCQGKTCPSHWAPCRFRMWEGSKLWFGKHADSAYIYFWKKIPIKIVEKLKNKGIHLYSDNTGVSSFYNIKGKSGKFLKRKCKGTQFFRSYYTKAAKELAITLNRNFVKIVRWAFGI